MGVEIKVKERGGILVSVQLFKPEGSQVSCGAPNCYLDMAQGRGGGHHHRAGCVYKGTCNYCAEKGVKAEYVGERGFSGYTRCLSHLSAVRQNKPRRSALADHLQQYHPEAVGQGESCSVKVIRTYKKPLDRQIAKAVLIHQSESDISMNRKEEWVPPVTYRVQQTQEPRQNHTRGAGKRRRGE